MATLFTKKNLLYLVTLGVLLLVTIFVSLQSISSGTWIRPSGLESYYNNYLIFKTSAIHLFDGLDLYDYHFGDHYDLYKYSPVFAMFMTPFNALPDWLGLIIWNTINLIALITGLSKLPGLDRKKVAFILLISALELIGSTMNEQSNALMSGLMVLGLAYLEKDKPFLAMMYLVFSVYIKLFSLVVFMIIIFYRSKYKCALYTVFWFVIFAILPVMVTGWDGLINTYKSWFNLLGNDYESSVGFSVLGILVKWFNYKGSRNLVFLLGVFIMILPLIKTNQYKLREFRYAVFSAILIWIIIFNHKAESPTFIIAMTGMGIYFTTQKFNLENKLFLAFALIFVSLVYSDLMPPGPRNTFFHPYFIKALPCILVWGKIIVEVMFNKLKPVENL